MNGSSTKVGERPMIDSSGKSQMTMNILEKPIVALSGSTALSPGTLSSQASSPLQEEEDSFSSRGDDDESGSGLKKVKKKSKETRIRSEIRQWIKSSVVSSIVESSLALAIKRKKPIKMSTAAVEEVRKKRLLEAQQQDQSKQVNTETVTHSMKNDDDYSKGFESVARSDSKKKQQSETTNTLIGSSSGSSQHAIGGGNNNRSKLSTSGNKDTASFSPRRRNDKNVPRRGTTANGNQLEQWPRAKEVPKRQNNTSNATASAATRTTRPISGRSWASAVSGIDTSALPSPRIDTHPSSRGTPTNKEQKINAQAPVRTKPVVENAWNTKPKGALAAAAAAIAETRTKEPPAATSTTDIEKKDTLPDMSSNTSDSTKEVASTTIASPEKRKDQSAAPTNTNAAESLQTVSQENNFKLAQPKNDKTSLHSEASTKTEKKQDDSKQSSAKPSKLSSDIVVEERKPVWGGKLPAALRAPPPQSQRITKHTTPQNNNPHETKEELLKAKNEADSAAYSARRASIGRQTEEERQRRMDECVDSAVQAERVAQRAWAAAGVEESHERRSTERARNAGAVRRRLAKDIESFRIKLDAAMAPQRLARKLVLANVSAVVKAMWGPHVDVALYGSSLTGLDLPSSDVDIVVRGLGFCATPLVSLHSPLHGVTGPVIGGYHAGHSVAPMLPNMGIEYSAGGTASVRSSSPTSSSRGSNERRGRQNTGGGSSRNQSSHYDAAAAAAAAAVAADAYFFQHGVVYMPYYVPAIPQMGVPPPLSSRDSICATEESEYGVNEEEYEDVASDGDTNSAFGGAHSAESQRQQNISSGDGEQSPADMNEEDASFEQNRVKISTNGTPTLQIPQPPRTSGNQPNAYAAAFVPPSIPSPLYRQQQVNRIDLTRQQYPLRSPTPPATAPVAVVQCLKALAQALSAQPWVKELKCIETASIPVIKLLANPALLDPPAPLPAAQKRQRPRPEGCDTSPDLESVWGGALGRSDEGLLAVDISFEAPNHGGLASSRYAVEAMHRWPEIKPLMLVLKELLVQRGLNEPFTGGLSSYSLLLLVLTTLLQAGVTPMDEAVAINKESDDQRSTAPDTTTPKTRRYSLGQRMHDFKNLDLSDDNEYDALGYLLVFFFDFFGRQFDPASQAISVLRGDRGIIYLNQPGSDGGDFQQMVTPIIEDPLEYTRNVARSCFAIAQIQHVFAHCSSLLEIKGTAAAVREEEVLPFLLNY
eukprot:CAMPEP_0197307064 /NCGR_PEP_ID=MMETSP0891-20130614/4486_1 /TAXON_ID=44058 ORGANISM="Aureoumbra lagunensis, Strain CCMP1510" /NCGR_SAMPLE_ID=MMETSP0891 /ASSEMBLY_ACC=CAM_ASM_000534 /LENGTH=1218 /DNA_ID=CAMNT_0042790043 /DNA_START=1 /DNA_END=3657 /DNA_ORIENTATION=+